MHGQQNVKRGQSLTWEKTTTQVPTVGENVKFILFLFLSFFLSFFRPLFLILTYFRLLTVGAGGYCTDHT